MLFSLLSAMLREKTVKRLWARLANEKTALMAQKLVWRGHTGTAENWTRELNN